MSTVLSFKPPAKLLKEPPAFLDAIPLAMYACDTDGRLTWFNRRAVALWGREPKLNDEGDRYTGALRLYSRDGSLDANDRTVMRVLKTGVPVEGAEAMIERPDGTRIASMAHVSPIKDGDGRTIGAISCFHASTELRRTQDDPHESERTARELLDALPVAIYTTDVKGRITFYNTAAAELWGRRPELGVDYWCGCWKLFWPDGQPMKHDECPMALALKEGKAIRGYEAVAERPDGTRFPFIPYPTPLRNKAGEMIGAVNMLMDISRRRTSEQRLELLSREVNHRAKNMLAVIQSIVRLSTTADTRAFADVLLGRITALGRAHNLLSENQWESASLRRLIEEELAPFRQSETRVRINGPRLSLSAATAQPVSMVLHELTTNAAKYGALSAPAGNVTAEWVRNPDGRIVLRWIESGGPEVGPPARQNFGLNVIGIVVRSQIGGNAHFDWRREGLICTVEIPATAIADTAD